MKRLLWFSPREEKPIIELVLSADSAQWLADHIPEGDRARDELIRAILECTAPQVSEGAEKSGGCP